MWFPHFSLQPLSCHLSACHTLNDVMKKDLDTVRIISLLEPVWLDWRDGSCPDDIIVFLSKVINYWPWCHLHLCKWQLDRIGHFTWVRSLKRGGAKISKYRSMIHFYAGWGRDIRYHYFSEVVQVIWNILAQNYQF